MCNDYYPPSDEPMRNILEEAQRIVNGQRRDDYGDMYTSFKRIAGMWSSYLETEINMFDVAQMMIMLKCSRAKTSPLKMDNLVDIIGYALCHEQLSNECKMEESIKK